MHSHIKLDVAFAEVKTQSADWGDSYCRTPLKCASVAQFETKKGKLRVQSISHYLASIDLFEHLSDVDSIVRFSITEPCFLMFVDSRGSQLIYCTTGTYRKWIPAGDQAMLVLSFELDWMMRKCKKLPQMQALIAHYRSIPDECFSLPASGLSASIFKMLWSRDRKISNLTFDSDIHVLINDCFNKYYNKLLSSVKTRSYHEQKAADLKKFIELNYASQAADDVKKLAAEFMVSERNLARIAQIAFGLPLHEYVIKVRMLSSLKDIINTKKSIHEVARLNGYRDAFYFSKAFKRYFGLPPSQISRIREVFTQGLYSGNILPKDNGYFWQDHTFFSR